MKIKINNKTVDVPYTDLTAKISLTVNKHKLTLRTPQVYHSVSKYFTYNAIMTDCLYDILSWCYPLEEDFLLDIDSILEKYLKKDSA